MAFILRSIKRVMVLYISIGGLGKKEYTCPQYFMENNDGYHLLGRILSVLTPAFIRIFTE